MNSSDQPLCLHGPVLVFGGPYSNLDATQALLDQAARMRIPAEGIICTGDLVAYGADAAATVSLIRRAGCHVAGVIGGEGNDDTPRVQDSIEAGRADSTSIEH